jgi:hypothetical protein
MGPIVPEILVPFPEPLAKMRPAAEVRSTLLASSMQSLRERGLFERYAQLLEPEHRSIILDCAIGQWFPIEVGFAHYRACDRLGLSNEEQVQIGVDVSKRIHDTFLGVVAKMARGIGVTPWTLLSKSNLLFGRLFRGGGGTQISKYGPKEAGLEIARLPLLDIPYFRNGLRGIYLAGIRLTCDTAHVRVTDVRSPREMMKLRISWV